jgi:hypothetical protein
MLSLLRRLIITALISAPLVSQAQYTMQLRNGAATMMPNTTAKWIDSLHSAATGPVLSIVHFGSQPTQQQKETLAQQGITLLEYLPGNSYTALVKPALAVDKSAFKSIYGIVPFETKWKASGYVWQQAAKAKGNIDLLVTFIPILNATEIKQFLAAAGAQVNNSPMERQHAYKITIAADKVHGLAAWYGVLDISPATGMVPFDFQSRPVVKGNVAVAKGIYGGYNLTGDSITVGVGDNASGIYHADLKDRITNFNPGSMRAHGEHVNGIVAGAGIVDPMAEGMAPHAKLLDYMYDQVIPATGAMYNNYNMTITNNSYGVLLGDCDYSGTYDGYAHYLDTIALAYPKVLHVFASGNDGWMNCSPYLPGFATVGGGYQPAKNNVVVGSITDYLYQAGDESRGPTKDGRMKPEIVAVGLGAYSTIGIDDYEWAAGTSMAAPQVAGGLAVLSQRYRQLNGGSYPNADVLKTLLLNGAMDLGNAGPDFTYGFGSMDLSRSLKMIDANQFYINTLTNADFIQTNTITIPANTARIKVMLCWHDIPGSTASATELINDLDLTVNMPDGTTHRPLVCDPSPANVNNVATERVDHLNNVEQVTINNPPAGTYTIKVATNFSLSADQRYVVAYDIIPKGTQLTFPLGGEQLSNRDSIRIFWNTTTNDSSFKVELSTNNGSSWTTLAGNVAGSSRYCPFMPAGINSGNCLVQVTKNGTTETVTSARFAITDVMNVNAATEQCPTYVNIHWTPVPNATAYELLKKVGPHMQVVDTTTDTTYSFSGMSTTEKSYVAVQPVINGIRGYRSRAVIRTANDGTCTNPSSTGDLMAVKMTNLFSRRQNTSNALTNNESFTIVIRNLYTVPCSNFIVTYSMNGGAWDTIGTSAIIPANGSTAVTQDALDLSAPGEYNFVVAITNLALPDPEHANDTLRFTIKNIPNDTLALPFTDDFETMDVVSVTGRDSIGVSPNGHWDFTTNDTAGRMRTFVSETVTINGNRSISLDDDRAVNAGSNNKFTGTFNLGAYDTANTEVRLDFDYILHGTPKTADGNEVSFRTADNMGWAPLFTYDLNAYPGDLKKAKSISITDAARAQNRNFASSLQISFGQNDTSLIAARNYGNGITIDNLKLYTVANDAQLVSVVSPIPTNCGLDASQPLTVQVHNGVNYTLYNLTVYYREDGGAIHANVIDSIVAKATINFTFSQPLNMPAGTNHSVDVWLTAPGDTYPGNDSIVNYKFRNSQIVTSYPYLENFEAGAGGYYVDGINNSWQFGTPAANKINKAASGSKAWKTNLAGKYNNLEQSYLYSPCFDISGMNKPMLSFSAALDIEDCGNVLCDKAYLEYTYNGTTWIKLGAYGNGINWYDSTFQAWTSNGFTRWHVASIPIPKPLGTGSVINFRFALASDPGATFEGLAVDDIHIYDLANSILPAAGTAVESNNLSGNAWTNYLHDNQLMAAIQPQNNLSGNTSVTLYGQEVLHNPTLTQHIMPRSYTIAATNAPADSIGVRLYLTDSEFVNVVNDTTCMSCPAPEDAYRLGITQFTNAAHPSLQNNTLVDDTAGHFTYIPYKHVTWVPYDKGYYCDFKTTSLSELWMNDGGPTHNFPTGTDYLNFVAYRDGGKAKLRWLSLIDTAVWVYTIERSEDSISFDAQSVKTATHSNPGIYTDSSFLDKTYYYRLSWVMTGGNVQYHSPVRKVSPADDAGTVDFNAQMISKSAVFTSWNSYIDGTVNTYRLERATGSGAYTTLTNMSAVKHYGQYYSYTDVPGDLSAGTNVRYRLTAVFDNGEELVLPERIVEWNGPNTVGNIYPNPVTNGPLNIVWYAPAGATLQASLINMQGRAFRFDPVQAGQWQNTTQLTIPANLAKGVYLLRTVIDGKTTTNKVVVE